MTTQQICDRQSEAARAAFLAKYDWAEITIWEAGKGAIWVEYRRGDTGGIGRAQLDYEGNVILWLA